MPNGIGLGLSPVLGPAHSEVGGAFLILGPLQVFGELRVNLQRFY